MSRLDNRHNNQPRFRPFENIEPDLDKPGLDLSNSSVVQDGDYDANSILKADTDNTPVALTIVEQRLVGRLTGGVIDGIALGIADNNMVQIDAADVADNEFARFTAAGLESLTPAEVLVALSGHAAAAFSMNSQKITSLLDPTEEQDAATRKYVNDSVGTIFFNDGGSSLITDFCIILDGGGST